VADAGGERELSLAELARFEVRVRAVLDCTGGWYAEQDWTGVPVSAPLATAATRRACWSAPPSAGPAAGHPRRRGAAGATARLPGPAGGARPARVLVVAAAVPDYLTGGS
jgi:hypothetical protein